MNDSTSTRLGVALIVFVCLLQFLFLPFFGNINVAPKQFALVIFTLVAAAICLWRYRYLSLPAVSPLFVFFLLALFFSALTALHPGAAFVGLAVLVVALLFLLLTTHLAREDASLLPRLADGLLLAGTVISALGLYQYVSYLHFGAQPEMLIPWLLPPAGFRISGIFGQANLHALLLVLVLIAFSYRYGRLAAWPSSRWSWLRFVPVLLVGAVFFLTKSRSGMLALIGAYSFLGYYFWRMRREITLCQERKEFLRLIFTLLLAWGLTLAVAHDALAGTAIENTSVAVQDVLGGYDRSKSDEARFIFMTTALLIFLDHPLLGVGLDNYKSFLAEYQGKAQSLLHFEFDSLGYTRWAHNEYLQLLCEGGLAAFLPLALLLALLVVRFWRDVLQSSLVDRDLLYIYVFLFPFLLQSAFEYPLRYPSIQALFLVFLGILLARYRVRKIWMSRRRLWLVSVSLGLALLLLIPLFRQEIDMASLRRGIADVENLEKNLTSFSLLAHHPYSEYYVLKYALPSFTEWTVKKDDLWLSNRLLPYAERMTRIEESYWAWYNLSCLYAVAGRHSDAVAAVRRVIELNPVYEPAWAWQHFLNMQRVEKATGVSVEEQIERSKRDWEKISGGIQTR